jgi:hypothetical protein
MIARVTGKTVLLCALCACGPTPVSVEPDAAITPPQPELEELGGPEIPHIDVDPVSGCSTFGGQTYSPYRRPGGYPHDTVTKVPWRGDGAMYPNGMEDFSNYGTLPATVECGDDKGLRSYVDVTAGCLTAVQLGTYTRGKITTTSDGYYRSISLGYQTGSDLPAKWTDQSIEYRFYYTAATNTNGNPGFKAFTRYRTEDDLYVASWRMDGVAQIQKKHCGHYTPLIILPTFGAPTANAWHAIRFDAVGSKLDLYLDGALVASANDSNFTWGTTGIRIDSMDGAYIDDWHVFTP